jgi:ATP-dependent Lon protease
MFGNTNQPVEIMTRTSHLFAPMPDVIREDMAFLDRIHFYLPGWELPKMRNEFFTDHYGFVVDYLAEALHDLRRQNFTEKLSRHFSLGSHLNARDAKAVRKTVSGMLKVIHPSGECAQEELAELVEFALEGRRRVKEQLKKMGSFEYHQTSFSYIDNETRDERFVGVPEEGGRNVIAIDPLPPGNVYVACVNEDSKAGLLRIEVTVLPGSGRLRLSGGMEPAVRQSSERAFTFLKSRAADLGVSQLLAGQDVHIEAIDLLGNRAVADCGVSVFVAIYSALRSHEVMPATVVLGDLTIQGNIKSAPALVDALQLAMDSGAKRAVIPLENKRSFLEMPGDVVERVDPVFYSDALTAGQKALGL